MLEGTEFMDVLWIVDWMVERLEWRLGGAVRGRWGGDGR